MFKDLFQLISFSPASGNFARYLSHCHAERQGYLLNQLMTEQGHVLPEELIKRLQSSPLVYRVIHDTGLFDKGERPMQIQNFLAAEEGRDLPWQTAPILPSDALGYRYQWEGSWETAQRFRKFVVDFHSPWNRVQDPRSGVMSLPFRTHSAEVQAETLQRLGCAFALIDQVPAVAHFVNSFVSIIRVRIDESSFCGSEQYPGEVGTIRLHNPLSPRFTTLALAEGLVHEAIHNALCMFEDVIAPLAISFEDERTKRVFSPWTFNPIAHASFLHAVFVYYGIWLFLSALSSCGTHAHELTEAKFRNASGFLRGVHMRRYVEGYGQENPSIMKLLDAMQHIVTSYFRERL